MPSNGITMDELLASSSIKDVTMGTIVEGVVLSTKRIFGRLPTRSGAMLCCAVLVMALTGTWLLTRAHAATDVAAVESEAGSIDGGAMNVTDSTASNNNAVQFAAAAPGYYVNCNTGSDSNTGKSTTAAWKTTKNISTTTFNAGDTIYLAAGCTFANGDIYLMGNGTSAKPITVTSYGSGAAPVIQSNGTLNTWNSVQLSGSYQKVQNLKIINAYNAAVGVGADHETVQNVEMTNDGEGVEIAAAGQYALITHNNAHDLKMVVNTPTSVNDNDDYGATGYAVGADNVTISYNTCKNCIASSYDYGYDGGFVEVFNAADNLHVYGNTANNVDGFVEAGASLAGAHANNMHFDDNLLLNTIVAVHVNTGNAYNITANNLRFDNNTFVQTQAPSFKVFYDVDVNSYIRNNIFYLYPGELLGDTPYVHTNNLYYNSGSTSVDYALGSGEKIADPLFVNLAGGNYHLKSGSPARGMGTSAGNTADIEGKSFNNPPDAGAYQYK